MKKDRLIGVVIHVLACITFLLFPYIFWHGPDNKNKNLLENPFLLKDMLIYVILIGYFYLNYYVLIPKFYFQKKHYIFWTAVITQFFLMLVLSHFFSFGIISYEKFISEISPDNFGAVVLPIPLKPEIITYQIERNVLRFGTVFILSLLLSMNDRFRSAQKEKVNAELSYLRAQINPHFLFNSLNSIYSMAIEKSDNTANAVVKLSGMMRYAITEAHKDFVPLKKELAYITDYIDLQSYRLRDTVKLNLRISGDPGDKMIAPLILISIIENAFKYGVNPEQNSSIMVDLTFHDNFLVLLVKNNKVRMNVAATEKSGIGITNTKNRLNMIYPGMHKFEVEENAREYTVLLTLHVT